MHTIAGYRYFLVARPYFTDENGIEQMITSIDPIVVAGTKNAKVAKKVFATFTGIDTMQFCELPEVKIETDDKIESILDMVNEK